MAIPANLTYREVGALLMAVGEEMMRNNVCAPAALDGSAEEFFVDLMEGTIGINEERAKQLLTLDLHDAIDFME